ncbi:NaeI family type II restriction endonuclease [Glutamicibacter ardleyensis]|uniref:NaeI family type II restriction endonuclease n=1 Tax=Glutamicibacter ardleyensis TaxID=225894 RepID=UPI003FD262CB
MKKILLPFGNECIGDRENQAHIVEDPRIDADLQTVYDWLLSQPIEERLTIAVNDAIEYVLDGARTWRFDLDSPEVDSDERASLGTKLQYRVLAALGLSKLPPLDTHILGIPVELKGTVRKNWMIPREGQCQICLLIQVDSANERYQAFLMRTHRLWLNDGGNQDKKRTVVAEAVRSYALPVVSWTPLPHNPLKRLAPGELAVVFDMQNGIKRRLTALFGFLPDVVIPRIAIETVGANAKDVARRARQAKPDVYAEHGLVVLMGTWPSQRALAAKHGYDISKEAWIALSPKALGDDFEIALAMSRESGRK